jgi:hypothetical protein
MRQGGKAIGFIALVTGGRVEVVLRGCGVQPRYLEKGRRLAKKVFLGAAFRLHYILGRSVTNHSYV